MKNNGNSKIITRWRTTSVVAVLLLFCVQQLTAQARFYASAPKSVPVNQTFQLNLTLENANGSGLKPPAFTDFQLVGGPSTSTSMQWVNGVTTQSITYSYILKPKSEGTFTLGKASIAVSGVTMESNELTISVTQAVQQQARQQRNYDPYDPFGMMQDDPFEDPFFQPRQRQQAPPMSKEELQKKFKDDVIIKMVVNKSPVYKGEMLTATYKLYYRQNIAGFNVTKAPAFDGFWSQEVELDQNRRPKTETLNGKQYNVIEFLRYNLYPQRAGTLTVPPAEAQVNLQVVVNSGNPYDIFGMRSVQPIDMNLKTNAEAVVVKEWPEADKPADFAGAVGKFKYETTLSSKEAKTDEPVTYTIKIAGAGNLKFVEAPAMNFPKEFEVYDPKTKENISNSIDGMSGMKQYDYLVVPRQPGDYTIQAQSFSYFDPSTARYVTIKSPEFAVKVTGEPSKVAPTANADKQEVALLNQDIRYIKTATPDFDGSLLGSTAGYVTLYTTPMLLFIGLVAFKRRNENMEADIVGSKRRKALKLARKRLSTAEKHLAAGAKKNFYDEVSRSIWGYLGDKLTIDMAELSKDNVEDKLTERNAKPETIAKLKELLNTCDIALYAPVGEGGEMKQHFEAAMNLIADLENEIKTV